MSIMKKINKYGGNCILFRIDVYFSEYNLAAEVDEKGHSDKKDKNP